MIRVRLIFIACFFLAVICHTAAVAKYWQGPSNYAPDITKPSWMAQPWKGSSAAYRRVQTQIDGEVASGWTFDAIVSQWCNKAVVDPKNPVVQFGWGYAIDQARLNNNHSVDIENCAQAAIVAVRRDDPTNVYEYTRIRFLLDQEFGNLNNLDDAYLAPVGRRLLDRMPSDWHVHVLLINALASRKASTPDAFQMASDWVKSEPNQCRAHSALAFVDTQVWACSSGNNKSALPSAVDEYKKYLSLAPFDDKFRPRVEYLITALQHEETLPPWSAPNARK